MDFLITYKVPGVPDLQVGVNDIGHVGLIIGTEEATMNDPAQVDALQQVLEQARVDQHRIYQDRFRPREVTPELVTDALAAWNRTPGENAGMTAALKAAGLWKPGLAGRALSAWRVGYREHAGDGAGQRPRGAMAAALAAAIEAWDQGSTS